MNTRFMRRKPEGTVPAREGTVPAQKANTSTRIKRRITVEIDPEEWRGRGQPRALGLDDIVVDLEGHKGSRIIKRREALRMLGQMWATREEVAAFFKVHRKTLYNFFRDCPEALTIYEDGKLSGNVSQRRRNVRLAETSAAMSIFLSKNQLGMRDDLAVTGQVDHQHTMLHVLLQELGDGTHGKVIEHDTNDIHTGTWRRG
jgi:hypothetical protein